MAAEAFELMAQRTTNVLEVFEIGHKELGVGRNGRHPLLARLHRAWRVFYSVSLLRLPTREPYRSPALVAALQDLLDRLQPDFIFVDNFMALNAIQREHRNCVVLLPYDCFSLHAQRTLAVLKGRIDWKVRFLLFRRMERREYPLLHTVLSYPCDRPILEALVSRPVLEFTHVPQMYRPRCIVRRVQRLLIVGNTRIPAVAKDIQRFLSARPLEAETIQLAFWGSGDSYEDFPFSSFGSSIGFIENLQSLAHVADIAVFPQLSGVGFQCKLDDCIAAGLPVVADRFHLRNVGALDVPGCFAQSTHADMWNNVLAVGATDHEAVLDRSGVGASRNRHFGDCVAALQEKLSDMAPG